jgi:hypothetical protein
MTLRPGEVVLLRIDFHQTPGGKLRPAVVLLDSADDDFVAAPITSRLRVSDFDTLADRSALTEALRRAFSLDQ